MIPTIKILENISKNSLKNKDEKFTRLYRYLLREDIYYVAYKKLYANNGAGTKGVDDSTADGFSERYVKDIIEKLKNNTYQPKPVRRISIDKANGKKRPIGIPTFSDKLVQEVLRMILEAIYEPLFFNCSHGFRPKRSCHTALTEMKHSFTGTTWFIEGDITGCFDNINHNKLVEIIGDKVKDARIISLIYKFLKAGYVENWVYNNTYSGTPQGGIISPLFANIYLHELDKFVINLKSNFDKAPERKINKEYKKIAYQVESLSKKINNATEDNKPILLDEYKKTRAKLIKTPCKSQTDKKLKYIRYADDWVIGINGTKAECEYIKSEIKIFLKEHLKMELSEEKTYITHSSNAIRFLGYDISVRRDSIIKPDKNGIKKRVLNYKVELTIPFKDKIEKYLFSKKAVVMKNNILTPCSRPALTILTDLEIISTFNSEIRGICNYYNLAVDFYLLDYFSYLMEYSCLKTLANKHKSKISKIKNKYRDGQGKWAIPYETKSGKKKMYITKYKDCKSTNSVDTMPLAPLAHWYSTNTFENKLKEKVCELCGTTESSEYELHHVNKVKNLKNKLQWEKIMIAKRRKTLLVCKDCHYKIHNRTKRI